MNRTLPSAKRKLAPPGCIDQYWSPCARPEGEFGPCPSPVCERTSAAATLGVEARLGLERHQRYGRVGDGAGPAARERFWLRSPAAKVWLVPSVIWAIVTE